MDVNKYITVMIAAISLAMVGCSSNGSSGLSLPMLSGGSDKVANQYAQGMSDRIKYSFEQKYESWVEMPGKDPQQYNSRLNIRTMVLKRDVQSVESDGSAWINVTVESVEVTEDVNTTKTKNKSHYINNESEFKSDWKGQPQFVNKSYHIKVAPDSTVLEVAGLDKMGLNLKSPGEVGRLFTEGKIKKRHNRLVLSHYSPGEEKLIENPTPMIKANGIYVTSQKEKGAMGNVTLHLKGTPAYNVPKEFPPSPQPTNMFQSLIINAGSMNEMVYEGRATFNTESNKISDETLQIKSTILITEDGLTGQFGSSASKGEGSGGVMYAVAEIKTTFELLD